MTLFYSGVIIVGLILSVYNWFYLQEIETAKNRMGIALPLKVVRWFRGAIFACFFVTLSTLFTLFATFLIAK